MGYHLKIGRKSEDMGEEVHKDQTSRNRIQKQKKERLKSYNEQMWAKWVKHGHRRFCTRNAEQEKRMRVLYSRLLESLLCPCKDDFKHRKCKK
ncbi:hypothetical protein P170DRAFT_198249 [Aspergillus steynii IBT 23096]|uniref:Uncharacterized protein n=1 Tax=Aspergillus steynii IBT 23096 TaxID=1392250 RepID=A0A2I2G4N5_9EURO|nr:uncharacterized protein P170DRAFT_198249 [Aspergillus steynii IBT 23096]PLB47813.1 hypothetical protein P170DRAFT_198249 [Aspergillus steynii IBT 23096]